jgi:hypothetical protein
VGGRERAALQQELDAHGVGLNDSARALLADPVFGARPAEEITVARRTVGALGLEAGGSLSAVLAAVEDAGYLLCPPDTGPYLRLALGEQAGSQDPTLRVGRAPEGSLTISSAPLSSDDEFPKGFYLRVVEGVRWLRGYRCDDLHQWSAEDAFVVRLPDEDAQSAAVSRADG